MNLFATTSAAFLALATLAGPSFANGLVPGSSQNEKAQDRNAVNSIIFGTAAARANSAKTSPRSATTRATTTFGYPSTAASPSAVAGPRGLVPGSRGATRAAETRDLNAIIRGEFGNGRVN